MSLYTPTNPDLTGAVPNLVAVSSSDTFPNPGHTILHVKNAGGSPITVTIVDQQATAEAAALPGASALNGNVVVTVTNGTEKYIGPFRTTRFNDATGAVTVNYSGITTVTAEVIDAE